MGVVCDGRLDCISGAAMFHFKPDLPVVSLHLPPTSPSWCITSQTWCHFHAAISATHTQLKAHPTDCSCPGPHYLKGLLLSIFSFFVWDTTLFLSFCKCLSDHSQCQLPTPNLWFVLMNDRWPSYWQLGSWCHIITVSPFRQNYQITPVPRRPGRLTGQPTKEIQISQRTWRTLQTSSKFRFVMLSEFNSGNKIIKGRWVWRSKSIFPF